MITIKNTVKASAEKVWEFWNTPEHITKWSFASPDWHTPYAEADLREGGKFKSTMAAKDGSASFDFVGTYTTVDVHKKITPDKEVILSIQNFRYCPAKRHCKRTAFFKNCRVIK